MKKPFYDKFERNILLEDESFYASKMKLHIAFNSFVKTIFKPFKNFFNKANE
ncbi:hypothetical protein H9I45_15105 [Polaribacter haliotis]|uniref:Uncharacterized protein n=1 Tax=Polaribacter haliotis TaxID=1888915 RepID=A0A7L8AFB0_9FLAO|nr:hypothetical protein [Polaribacter haliotis]QOD60647.1 hypothetical protein H9I45_15105 [Polaribacter haliotis]